MSIIQAMFAGSSALTSFGEAMTVIGNNLANANTTAFKSSSSSFEDVLIQTVGARGDGASTQVGTGVGLASVNQNMSQGSFSSTANVTDLSIDGKGFFKVKDINQQTKDLQDKSGRPLDIFYTRAGEFQRDVKGDLVNSGGMVLQGWQLDEDGNQGTLGNINLKEARKVAATATSLVKIGVNLNEGDSVIGAPYVPGDPTTYNWFTSTPVFDSLGKRHNIDIEFRKLTEANSWEWHAVVKSDELDPTQASKDSTLTDVGKDNSMPIAAGASYTQGKLVFNTHGKLVEEGSTPINFKFRGADLEQHILFDFGDAINETKTGDSTNDYSKKTTAIKYNDKDTVLSKDIGNTGGKGSLQDSSNTSLLSMEQNGFPSGFLDKLAVNEKGEISGNYTNGQSKKLFQVVLVDFMDETSLEQVGSNLFVETVASGAPLEGEPTSGRLGNIISYSLEQSNVDMSAEFVRMITTQRGFQANSRIVTVTDGMLEELLALKR